MAAILESISSGQDGLACFSSLPESTIWLAKTGRIWSLLDVLVVYAPQYVQIGQMYQDYIHGALAVATSPKAVPTQQQYKVLLTTLKDLHKQCSQTHLAVSARTMERTIEEFEQNIPNFRLTQEKLTAWFACFTSELETQTFLLVEPTRVGYLPWKYEGKKLISAVSLFPHAAYDAYQAGCCHAFRCFTVAVYHLMRTAENGLVSVATGIGADADKISKGWDGCIQEIESKIKLISSTKPTTDWQAQIRKYSDLCSFFTTMKTGWRNPVSHIPRNYSETSSAGMFAAAIALFDHLSRYGFKQTTMPFDPLPLPGY